MKVICFDIGGTSVKYGVVEDGVILFKDSFNTHLAGGNSLITERLLTKTKEIKEIYDDIQGVGISCCGSIDFDKGLVITAPYAIPEFSGWNFTKIFEEKLGLKCIADNDVNSFAQCECKMGSGTKYKTFLVMTVGTGIGGAIVVNNQIWRGNNYNAGEIGRMFVDGAQWERIASMSALVKNAKLRGLDVSGGQEVFDLYDQGDVTAQIVVSEFYHNLGKGIANLVYIFNPEAVIIGGGISSRPNFGREVNAYADYYLVEGFQDTIDIVPATYKNDGGILGAYCNFVERNKEN